MADSSSTIRIAPKAEPLSIGARLNTANSDIDNLPYQGEFKMKRRALSRMAFHPDLARVLLDDAVSHRETQPGAPGLAFARGVLGGEKWIVNLVDVLGRDARAGIAYAHPNRCAVGGGDAQGSASGHGVFGVQEEIQKDLLELAGIAI